MKGSGIMDPLCPEEIGGSKEIDVAFPEPNSSRFSTSGISPWHIATASAACER